jgi:hypothetical protein
MATDLKNADIQGLQGSAQVSAQITLDQLISSTSQSVLRALQEHAAQQQGPPSHPRFWCGYIFDLYR